jgi:amidase
MARSARDLRLLLSVMEAGSLSARGQAPTELRDLRIGLWLDQPELLLDAEVRAVLEAFARELAAHGAQVTPVTNPVDIAALLPAYRTLLASLLAEDMPPAQLRQMQRVRGLAQMARAFGAGADSWAGLALDYTATHLEWLAANEVRAKAGAQARQLFTRFDAILSPVGPVPAIPHDHRPFQQRQLTLSDGSKAPYLAMLGWIAMATACGLPVTTVPAGQTAGGLPVGAQIIGPRGGDSRTLAIAEAIETRLGGFTAPPALATAPS